MKNAFTKAEITRAKFNKSAGHDNHVFAYARIKNLKERIGQSLFAKRNGRDEHVDGEVQFYIILRKIMHTLRELRAPKHKSD